MHRIVGIYIIALCALPSSWQTAQAASSGSVRICKKDTPQDYADQDWWRREVIVPVGAVFKDVGPIEDASGERIKLRIVTTQKLSLRGEKECGIVHAIIPADDGDWGNVHIGPVRTTISRSDQRLLEIERWGTSPSPPDKIAPWSDVVAVEATIQEDFR